MRNLVWEVVMIVAIAIAAFQIGHMHGWDDGWNKCVQVGGWICEAVNHD